MQFSGPSLMAEAAPADGMELGPRPATAAPDDDGEDFDHFFSSAPGTRGAPDPDAPAPADPDHPAAAVSVPASNRPPARSPVAAADSPATAPANQAGASPRAADAATRDPGRRRRGSDASPAPAANPAPVLAVPASRPLPLDPAAPPPASFLVGAWAQGGGELLSSSLAPAVRNAAPAEQGGAAPAAATLPNVPGPAASLPTAAPAAPGAGPTPPANAPANALATATTDQALAAEVLPIADSALPPTLQANVVAAPPLPSTRREGRPLAAARAPADEVATAPAAASANPVTAPAATSAPAASPAGNQPVAAAEKFAAPAPLAPTAIKSVSVDTEKKLLTVDGDKATGHAPAVGTASAESAPVMTTSSFLHAATFLQGVADRSTSVQASQTSGGVSSSAIPAPAAAAPLATSGAPEAVAAVMKLIQAQANQSQGGVSAVNLSFKFGDDDLSVRVAWRDGIVQTQFRTDSDELRAALAGEWQTMSAAPASRALPLATPVFSSSSDSASASGGESRQSAQSGFGRDWGQSDGGSAAAPLVPSGPVSPRRPPPLVAAGRLHAFA